jgi:hypothetical protein
MWSRNVQLLSRNVVSSEQLLSRNVKQFRGGLVLKADRLVYRSTLGSRVIKKKKSEHLEEVVTAFAPAERQVRYPLHCRVICTALHETHLRVITYREG